MRKYCPDKLTLIKYLYYICIGCMAIFTSCNYGCHDVEERMLEVRFINFSTQKESFPDFTSVYSSGYKKDIFPVNGKYYLPLSLLSDTVIYVFEKTSSSDTLAISYTRDSEFQSVNCGFTTLFSGAEVFYTTFKEAKVYLKDRQNALSVTNMYDDQVVIVY